MSAAAMLEPEHCMMIGMFWSVAAFEREQRLGRLRLVVEGDDLELAADGATAAVDVVEDVLELLQVLIAHLREGPREWVGVHDLDRAALLRGHGARAGPRGR
jgi:DNA invertase Pin-like site-specific DNA recombinase